MEFSPEIAVLQAKMQAWCVGLLTILADAYKLGAVLGKGAVIRANQDTLSPDVMFVPTEDRKIAGADVVRGPPLLAIDIIYSSMSRSDRTSLQQRYANAGVLEYWQIEADKASPLFYQASATGSYDLILPDKQGVHFSTAIVELSFPVVWFRRQPDLFTMMSYWDIIHD